MEYRTFGWLGWQVSKIGYGMWGMGGWSGSDDDESIQSLHEAVRLGYNFFDTASAYGERSQRALAGPSGAGASLGPLADAMVAVGYVRAVHKSCPPYYLGFCQNPLLSC